MKRIFHRQGYRAAERRQVSVEFLAPFAMRPVDEVFRGEDPESLLPFQPMGLPSFLPRHQHRHQGLGVRPPEFKVRQRPAFWRNLSSSIDGE